MPPAEPHPEKIIEALAEQPGLKAKEIADTLGLERRDVNSLLYGRLRNQLWSDSKYRWYRIEDAPDEAVQEEKLPDTPLGSLCRYYLDCLAHDDDEGVSVFARSKYELDYCELEDWPFGGRDFDPFSEEAGQRLVNQVRRDRFSKVLFLGYPTFIRPQKTRRSTYYFVEPLFLFSCEFDFQNRFAPPQIQGDLCWLNLRALKSLPIGAGDSPLQESIRLAEFLGIDRSGRDPAEFDEVVERLKAERPDWRWCEEPDPYNLNDGPPLSEVSDSGLYNRAVLVMAERSRFTLGLETELNKLMRLEEEEYRDTALGRWLANARLSREPAAGEPLLEALPLNTEQRAATWQGLENELTVVTGPPGTGKSQVVTSLLINAAWRGTKVLVASRNNKAVDVVEARVNGLGPRPVLLRLGSQEYQRELAEYLGGLLSAKSGSQDRARYQEAKSRLDELRARHQDLEQQLEGLVALRNEVDELERAAEDSRKVLGEELFRSVRELDPELLVTAFKWFESLVDRATRGKQPLLIQLFWFALRKNRYARVAEGKTKLAPDFGKVGLEPPVRAPDDGSIEEWRKLAYEATVRARHSVTAKRYLEKLETLRNAEPLERLQREQFELVRKLNTVSQTVWDGWLALQPSRLDQGDRRLLGEYASQLRLLVAASDNKSKAGAAVHRRYYELFPQIARFLPCWALTNLTARRLPFMAGFFDLVVIDEASQCDIASALPLLFRAKRAVIIGDPKQLRHISGISERQDQALLEKHELIENHLSWSYSVNSLYDLASHLCASDDIVALRDHHRSHADIISFSNEEFYEGHLRVATPYDRLISLEGNPAVRWQHVEGRVTRPRGRSALNEAEALAVGEELERVLVRQGYSGTVGVVTPFRAHANRIRDLVSRNATLTQAMGGREFISDTAHGFQGDERDLMIFSPVVSQGMSEPAIWFLENNGYLFNVAITRARGALIVVGNRSAAADAGVGYLQKFVDYVHRLENGEDGAADSEYDLVDLDSLGPEYPEVRQPERVSDWERLFYKALYREGIRTIPQYNVEKYALDLALFDGDRRLDIEIDGERYHRRWDGELLRRDQIRNFRLIELGWDVMRFWVYEVRDELDSCVGRVKAWLAQEE